MKRISIFIACTTIVATASAQLKVASNGQVEIGTSNSSSSSSIVRPGTGSAGGSPDTIAALRIKGDGLYDSGGRLAFGSRGHAYIEESTSGSFMVNPQGILRMFGAGGLVFTCGDGTVFSYDTRTQNTGATTGTVFTFSKTVSAPQYLTTSDARSKTDIEPLENMGSQLRDIVPVSYTLIQNGGDSDETAAGSPRKSNVQDQGGVHHQYGFLAQDVREVYPELVYEDSEGMLSIDYTGFIPILVDAIQNLQSVSESQARTIAEQADEIAVLKGEKRSGSDADAVVASLSQNRPNPFRTSTVISCVLPDGVSEAFLCVYDLNGNQKMRRDIPQRGSVDITIEGNTLTAGMYIYTLVADGIEIDSKRMILTD